MKVDLNPNPPALPFGSGDDAFDLFPRRFDDEDRMRVFDAINSGRFEDMARATNAIIRNWGNVLKATGEVLDFHETEDGKRKCNLPAFLGALPVSVRTQVMCGIMAFVGVPRRVILAVTETLVERAVETDPTKTSGGSGSTSV